MMSRTKVITGFAIFTVVAIALALFYRERRLVAACRPVSFVDETRYRAAGDLFNQASKALSSRNYSTANDLLDMSVSRMENAYQMAGDVDDTEMTLGAGRAEAARGNFQLAARMKQSAMQMRLSMFRRRQHLSERCNGILGKIGL